MLGAIFLVALALARSRAFHPLARQANRAFGTALAIWCVVEAVAIGWRLVGMRDPRLIPFVVLAIGAMLVMYPIWYTVWQRPRDRQRFDRLREQLSTRDALRAGRRDEGDGGRRSLWTLFAGAVGAAAFYLALFPSVDHGLHQVSIGAGAALGYAFGRELTANSGIYGLAARAARQDRELGDGG